MDRNKGRHCSVISTLCKGDVYERYNRSEYVSKNIRSSNHFSWRFAGRESREVLTIHIKWFWNWKKVFADSGALKRENIVGAVWGALGQKQRTTLFTWSLPICITRNLSREFPLLPIGATGNRVSAPTRVSIPLHATSKSRISGEYVDWIALLFFFTWRKWVKFAVAVILPPNRSKVLFLARPFVWRRFV